MTRARSASVVTCLLLACGQPAPSAQGAENKPALAAAKPEPAGSVGPHFVRAGHGPADTAIREATTAAGQLPALRRQRVVVYIGASWCEPCTAFHDAVSSGQLDAQLANVRFVEFDWDLDQARLTAAGYGGRLIPRFALANADGRFSGRKIEGGVKGDKAVGHIMARLVPLLSAR